MLAITLSILLIASSTALDLKDPMIFPTTCKSFEYLIAHGETKSSIIERLSEIETLLELRDHKFIETIGSDIKSRIDTLKTTPVSLEWEFDVVPNPERLNLIKITANLHMKETNVISLNLTAKKIVMVQHIPIAHDSKKVCYPIPGGKGKRNCHEIFSQKKLDGIEKYRVEKNLRRFVNKAKAGFEGECKAFPERRIHWVN